MTAPKSTRSPWPCENVKGECRSEGFKKRKIAQRPEPKNGFVEFADEPTVMMKVSGHERK